MGIINYPFIIVAVFATLIAGAVYSLNQNFIQASNQADFSSTSDCKSTCLNLGFSKGDCIWPNQNVGASVQNLGSCVIPNTRHCGTLGSCNCYCWTPQTTTTQTVSSIDFSSVSDCKDECSNLGYNMGDCIWPIQAVESAESLGSCVLAEKHCSTLGACNCYCWNV